MIMTYIGGFMLGWGVGDTLQGMATASTAPLIILAVALLVVGFDKDASRR